MFKINKNNGQSVVEIVIAMGLFVVLVGSVGAWLLNGLNLLARSQEYNKAQFLAQELTEALIAIKSYRWNELIYSQSTIIEQGGRWIFAGEETTGQIGKFNRTVYFSDIYRDRNHNIASSSSTDSYPDALSKQASVEVSWPTSGGGTHTINNDTLISAWNSFVWAQEDWQGGGGQAIWQEVDMFEIDDGNINYTNSIKLKEFATSTYALSGYLVSSGFDTGSLSSIIALGWEEEIPLDCGQCQVKLQIKTALDGGGQPDAWSNTWCGPEGEDGDEEDYFTQSNGRVVNVDHNLKQWVKYRVLLLGSGSSTPEVSSIKLYYQENE